MATRLETRAITLFDTYRDAGFTSSDPAKQVAKMMEEVGEFTAAVMTRDLPEALMEAGDVAWLLVDILHVLGCEHLLAVGMATSLEKLVQRHGEIAKAEGKEAVVNSKELDQLANQIKQGFMQPGGWKACRYLLGKLVADLQTIVVELPSTKCIRADRLAYECATAALRGQIRTRTRLTDSLEDYLEIGCIDGPKTVPDWVKKHEAAEAAGKEVHNAR